MKFYSLLRNIFMSRKTSSPFASSISYVNCGSWCKALTYSSNWSLLIFLDVQFRQYIARKTSTKLSAVLENLCSDYRTIQYHLFFCIVCCFFWYFVWKTTFSILDNKHISHLDLSLSLAQERNFVLLVYRPTISPQRLQILPLKVRPLIDSLEILMFYFR